MALAQVDVANLALRALGRSPIASLAEASVEARTASFWLPISSETALAAQPWTFARRISALAMLVNDLPDLWEVKYDFPGDCLRFGRVFEGLYPEDHVPPVPHKVIGRAIYTNLPAAYGEYTFRAISPGVWPMTFTRAVGYRLAADMAPELTRKSSVQAEQESLYVEWLGKAAEYDASQQPHYYTETSSYEQARSSGAETRWRSGTGGDGSSYWTNE